MQLFAIPLTNHTVPGDTVYDPFRGSGTAIIAAEKLGRACLGVEIHPPHVHAAVTRWEQFSGGRAIRHRVPSKRPRRSR